jgi:excisionase family DNA binding protein
MSNAALAPEPMMTAEDVAAFLRISLSMVYKLRREQKLAGVQVGTLWRFSPDHVRAFARGELPPPPGPGAPVVPIAGRRRRV